MKKLSKPCEKCPYKLGIIKTFVNPCPQCELDGYKTFETLQKQLAGGVGNKHEERKNKCQ